jgi:pantoate--beta-alanine ligase
MYPSGEQTRVRVTEVSQGLCGAARPGHFEGVATVVAKLFNAVGPGTYIFGQKDYQQWRLIEQMARDLLFPVQVVGMPIVREPDGVALSSRNAFLKPDERHRARVLARSLQAAITAYRDGVRDSGLLIEMVKTELAKDALVDYVEARDPKSLESIQGQFTGSMLLAAAVYLGTTRLIDNVVLAPDVSDILREGAQ